MTMANLAVRFIVELLGVGALGYWGFGSSQDLLARTIAGIGAPLLLIIVWAVVVAPNADNALAPQVRVVIGTVMLLVAAAALALAGQPVPGAVLAALVIINQVLLIVLGSDVPAAIGRAAGPRA